MNPTDTRPPGPERPASNEQPVGFPPFRGGLLIADGASHLRHPDAIGSLRGRSSDLRGWFHAARSFRARSVSRSASICS